jgi:hypothetical protein
VIGDLGAEFPELALSDLAGVVLALDEDVDRYQSTGQLTADVELHVVELVVDGGAVAEELEDVGDLVFEALGAFEDLAVAFGVG